MLNILNKKGKIILGSMTIGVIALVCVFVGGDNQQAEANEQGSISINLTMSDLKDVLGMFLGGFSSDTAIGGSVGGSRFPSGLSADDTSPSTGEVRGATFTSTGAVTFGGAMSVTGETRVQGFTQGGGVWATSTQDTTVTLTEANLLAYNVITMTQNTGAMTLTLPATSTMATLLSTDGDMREWLIHNATTTAASTMTIAAGAGIDLIGVTANDDVIDGTEWSRLSCYRVFSSAAALDITCIVSELLAVD